MGLEKGGPPALETKAKVTSKLHETQSNSDNGAVYVSSSDQLMKFAAARVWPGPTFAP
jgi:hypothetical protein